MLSDLKLKSFNVVTRFLSLLAYLVLDKVLHFAPQRKHLCFLDSCFFYDKLLLLFFVARLFWATPGFTSCLFFPSLFFDSLFYYVRWLVAGRILVVKCFSWLDLIIKQALDYVNLVLVVLYQLLEIFATSVVIVRLSHFGWHGVLVPVVALPSCLVRYLTDVVELKLRRDVASQLIACFWRGPMLLTLLTWTEKLTFTRYLRCSEFGMTSGFTLCSWALRSIWWLTRWTSSRRSSLPFWIWYKSLTVLYYWVFESRTSGTTGLFSGSKGLGHHSAQLSWLTLYGLLSWFRGRMTFPSVKRDPNTVTTWKAAHWTCLPIRDYASKSCTVLDSAQSKSLQARWIYQSSTCCCQWLLLTACTSRSLRKSERTFFGCRWSGLCRWSLSLCCSGQSQLRMSQKGPKTKVGSISSFLCGLCPPCSGPRRLAAFRGSLSCECRWSGPKSPCDSVPSSVGKEPHRGKS